MGDRCFRNRDARARHLVGLDLGPGMAGEASVSITTEPTRFTLSSELRRWRDVTTLVDDLVTGTPDF